jgi:hypothetical protein
MAALEKTKKNQYAKKHPDAPDFKIGEKVWVKATNIQQNWPSQKFSDNCVGLYKILERIEASSYKPEYTIYSMRHCLHCAKSHRCIGRRNIRICYQWQAMMTTKSTKRRDTVISS